MPVQTQKHQLASGVQLSRTGDRCVLFNSNTGTAIVLNPTGTILAELLKTVHGEAQLASQLLNHFSGLDKEQATTDTAAFLQQLQNHKMVVVAQ